MRVKVIVGILILLILGVVIFGFFFFSKESYESKGVPITGQNNSTPTVQDQTMTSDTKKTETPAVCVASLAAEVKQKETQYEKGTILVSFPAGTSVERANAVLSKYSLKLDLSGPSNFATQSWGAVKVTPGAEFSSICALRADAGVKFAGINPVIQLHE